MDPLRRGYLYGLGAYLCWGFFPIYFKELRPAGPVEILAHRVVWSVVFVALVLTVVRHWPGIRALLHRPRTLLAIGGAALLIAVNWGVYIYGVNSAHVVETSLGYFITPLVSVLFGMVFFAERLRPWQWLAVGIGALAVVVLTVDYGRLPWIALTLAVSFGSYALVKKRLGLPPAEGLLLESSWLALPALGYLAWLTARGDSTFSSEGAGHTVLLALAGVATAVPLLLFAGAANRVPLVGLGILQYLTPCLQLVIGVFLYHEPMPPARLAGFILVWLALALFTTDALRSSARRRSAAALPGKPTGARQPVRSPGS
jgi:chloramphenicol-sensitive protein RarD